MLTSQTRKESYGSSDSGIGSSIMSSDTVIKDIDTSVLSMGMGPGDVCSDTWNRLRKNEPEAHGDTPMPGDGDIEANHYGTRAGAAPIRNTDPDISKDPDTQPERTAASNKSNRKSTKSKRKLTEANCDQEEMQPSTRRSTRLRTATTKATESQATQSEKVHNLAKKKAVQAKKSTHTARVQRLKDKEH
jgi:hypothetical protein